MTATTTTPTKRTVSFGSALVAGLIGGVIAAVVNAIIFLIAQSLNGGPLLVVTPQSPTPDALDFIAVVLLSLLPGLIAGALYWALARFTSHPTRWLLVISAVVFVAFFFGPITSATGAVTIWALELMHVVAAAAILWAVLTRTDATPRT